MNNSKAQIELEKKQFYDWARNNLAFSRNEVISILNGIGYQSFNRAEIPEYKNILQNRFLEISRECMIERLKHSRVNNWKCPLSEYPGIECEGIVVGLRCSVGGSSHIIAASLYSHLQDFDISAWLEKYQEIHEKLLQEQQKFLEYWHEQLDWKPEEHNGK